MDFVLDTCSIIAGRDEIYGAKCFPQLWKMIDTKISSGEIYVSPLVFNEVKSNSPTANTWLGQHSQAIKSLHSVNQQAIQQEIADLINNYSSLGRTNSADYEVIAIGKIHNAIVVSEEKPNKSTQTAVNKIPSVCSQMNVTCMTLYGMISKYGWQF